MTLTFQYGHFQLLKVATSAILSPAWILEGEFKSGRTYITNDINAAVRFRRYADRVAERVFNRAFVKQYALPSLPPLPFLDPHQLEGVKWILTRSRSYLAHAPGAGKTAQAVVASLLSGGSGQVLFIVPPSLTVNWEREIIKWTEWANYWPAIAIVPVSAKRQEMGWAAEYIICPDSMLTKPWVLNRLKRIDFKFVAVDEASRFKEDEAERTRALFGGRVKQKLDSPGLIQKAKHAVLLDGSPMPNRPMELWAPTFAMAGETINFMSKQDFGFRYCGATLHERGHWEFKHSANEEELRGRLQKKFMHVVTEDQLSHPERRRAMLFMNVDARSPEQKTWERKHLKTLSFDEISEDMNQGEIAKFRRELGLAKVPWIANYVKDRLNSKDESILLFAWHREVVHELATALHSRKPGVVMGGTRASVREEIFANFQSGKTKVIIGNIGAMGRGHNLQRADRVVFGEFSFTDELNKQCEKRASRKGSTKGFVRCDYIVSPGSMDEPILNAVFRKEATVKKVIG